MAGSTPFPRPETELPLTLRAAVGLVSIEALAEAIWVAMRTELRPALRVVLVLCVGSKWAAAWGVTARRPGAALALLLLEGSTILAALSATESADLARWALGVAALAVIVLLLLSLDAFPPPRLPQ